MFVGTSPASFFQGVSIPYWVFKKSQPQPCSFYGFRDFMTTTGTALRWATIFRQGETTIATQRRCALAMGGLDSFFDVRVGFVAGKYKLELPPHPGCNRHHQDYEPFLVGNPYKPFFVTVTGWGVDRRYKTYHMEVLKKMAVNKSLKFGR